MARQCAVEQVDYPRYLLRMTELELLDRERRATERRIRQAKFPVVKTMDSFDFLAIPSLNKTMVLELARCEFLARRENVLLLGNSGTGKTHIALALGLAACQRGHRVRFTTAAALVSELIEARDEKKLLRFQKQIASYELLIVDELGFVPLSKTGAELLFEMLSQRYERGSTLVTSNLPFQEWTEVLGSERLTGALLDRLTHHVHILEMNGDSYRLKQSRRKRSAIQPLNAQPTTARRTRRGEKGLFRYAPDAFLPANPQQPPTYLLAYFYSATLACFYSALDTSQHTAGRLQWATFWATIETLIAALVAAVFTLGQWRTMNKTYGEIEKQTTTAIEASRKQFSSDILYDNSRIDVSKDGKRYNVSIQLKNVGQTPAYSVTHWVTAQDMPRLADPFKHFDYRSQSPIRFVKPGFDGIADIGGGQSICLQGNFTVNGKPSNAIYVWGDVKYSDVFNRCECDAFVLQSNGNIASGKLSNVFNWTSDTGTAKGKCDNSGVCKIPWPEDRAPEDAVAPVFSVFQGECQK